MTVSKSPSMLDSLIPVIALVLLLSMSVYLFGSDASSGSIQIALTLGAAIAAIIAIKNGRSWDGILKAIVAGISSAMGAILILLSVGALIGTWLMSGTVPTLVYYGLELLNPHWFFATTCLICAIAGLSTGSSWTVAGTLGIALIGVAIGLNLSPAIAAGAVVSGAYFGDKMSPLSDTTNLAPGLVDVDIFEHIRHMMWTTTPAMLLALLMFAAVGLAQDVPANSHALDSLMAAMNDAFNINLIALLPLVVVFVMAFKKIPPLPTILFGALLGGILALILQPDVVLAFAASPELPAGFAMTKGVVMALANGYVANTGVAAVDNLLTRGGMSNMLVTIWLILSAMSFGAVLEHAGMLDKLIESTLRAAKSTGSLILTVVLSCIGLNVVAADQYMAIVLPGRMYKAEFERRNLDPRNLSRVIEDSGTVTSPLVPWNTCGAFMASTLGVATLSYMPFAFFNLLVPLVSVIYGYTGFTIRRIEPKVAGTAA
ncbi:MAG TPA: Na+/H+ antiporter NhaC [Woeseiaceae bacterium]|nr:Na+/H+ antiporter NhaC [Woeseiaceae bacterium]